MSAEQGQPEAVRSVPLALPGKPAVALEHADNMQRLLRCMLELQPDLARAWVEPAGFKCRELVRQHNGRNDAENLARGVRFTMQVPFERTEERR